MTAANNVPSEPTSKSSVKALAIPYTQPEPGHRDWYLFEAVRSIPRILLMLDKNPASPSYGSFDREYWHYRTIDFPCGMNQEFALAIAKAFEIDHPQNPFFECERILHLADASIAFAARSAHADGTCDDYFPNEKALGALVFSLYAMAESCRILPLKETKHLPFLRRRADWLLKHNESGQLANHQALAALALYTVYQLTGEDRYRRGSDQFLELTLSWQNEEGWFQEYEGADPGYHSCSIDFLAKLRQKSGNGDLTPHLHKAIRFARHFIHPDGSYAGEYGSRNTYHFYPHGFELMAPESNDALEIVELFLRYAMPRRSRYYNDDNRMCAHYVYDWIQAWQDYAPIPERSATELHRTTRDTYFDQAGLFVRQRPDYSVVISCLKGGTLKIVGKQGPLYSDTGILLQSEDQTLVSHLVNPNNRIEVQENPVHIRVEGHLCKRRAPLMTPLKHMLFRILVLTIGRLNPNWVRILIQKLFITGKVASDIRFNRVIQLHDDRVEIIDSLEGKPLDKKFKIISTPDATSIYVANSNTFQLANLLPVRPLHDLERSFTSSGSGREVFTVTLPQSDDHFEQ
jgi:hypothetical protein